MTTKKFLTLGFVLSLVIGFLMMSENQTELKTMLSAILCCLIAILFFVWVANQCYDFERKKLKKLSIGSKVIVVMFLFFVSINGGAVGTISLSILVLLTLVQIFYFFVGLANRK